MKKLTFIVLFISLLCRSVLAVDADEMIAKAREFMGGDDKLDSVETLVYYGTITNKNGSVLSLEMRLEKPNKQLMITEDDEYAWYTATNGFESYDLALPKAKNTNPILKVQSAGDTKRMNINAMENLYFFHPAPGAVRKLVDEGVTRELGQEAHKLMFQYSNGSEYTRYFEPETGDLLATINEVGLRMEEQEDMIVQGIRFPKYYKAYTEDGELAYEVVFTDVRVNDNLISADFDFPSRSRIKELHDSVLNK